ncbi:ribonuclease H1-like, partial [Leptopilina heterotoma]|uniref:ribonuclease H1-like n=1 Tax=Leptopilina heterotoma TaxID=63436 RepID=UPI001CA91A17
IPKKVKVSLPSTSAEKRKPGRPKKQPTSAREEEKPIQQSTELEESTIASRLKNRKRITSQVDPTEGDQSSSEDSSSNDDTEQSDPPVFRSQKSTIPALGPPTPRRNSQANPCTEVYIDGACQRNGNVGSTAGIGVWFGENHPLNVSQRATGKQTNNAAEIEAAIVAVRKAKEAGYQRLKVITNSQFLIDSMTKWLPRWKSNDWKTTTNKAVQNRAEFEQLEKAMNSLDVTFKHVPSHQGIFGNEMADQLATQAIENAGTAYSVDESEVPADSNRPTIVDLPPVYNSSESDSEEDVSAIQKKSDIRIDLEKSIKKFNESLGRKGINPIDLTTRSLAWDHEGMDESIVNRRNCVSEGKSNEELLKDLEEQDPCGDYDDKLFSSRINEFLG